MPSDKLSLSILVPTFNEEQFIIYTLDSLAEQTVNSDMFEVIVIDGMSTDNTKDLVLSWHGKHPRINLKLIENKKIITPAAFNEGLEVAEGEYVTLFGAHSTVPPNFVEKVLETFSKHPDIEACGGVVETVYFNNSRISKAISYINQLPFGVGSGMRTQAITKEGYANSVAKVTYKKDIFNEVGKFDEGFVRNQDIDMNHRIQKKGGKIWLNPEIKTTYYSRNTLKNTVRTAFYNSYFHSLFLKKHHKIPGIKYVIPSFFVLSLTLSLLFALINILGLFIFAGIIALHQVVALGASIRFWKQGVITFILLPILSLCLHLSYGVGLIAGMIDTFIFKRKSTSPLNVR
jgi:glycosyltransferase involved in cell wall biosynthesis